MKFLVDAQIPGRISRRLVEQGFDCLHTLDLKDQNRTSDARINQISIEEKRVVITKDTDFVDSIIVGGKPYKLLLIIMYPRIWTGKKDKLLLPKPERK